MMNAQAALNEFEPDANVEWINDVYDMVKIGIVRTPAVMINDDLKVAGRIPSVFELTTWMEEEMVKEIAA
jgi:hypothetical protein